MTQTLKRTRQLRPPAKCVGGKFYLAPKIIPLLPEHTAYIEPYGGMASVLLNKPPAPEEIYNDLDMRKVNLLRVIRDQVEELIKALKALPYAEGVFAAARTADAEWDYELTHSPVQDTVDDPIGRAVNYYVRCRMSRGGLGETYTWSKRTRGGQPEVLNSWQTMLQQLPLISKRLNGVIIKHGSALDLIRGSIYGRMNNTLIYADPVYVPSTRTAKQVYGAYEMGEAQHEEMLRTLLNCQCKVVISGYDCPLYRKHLRKWHRQVFDLPNNAGQGKEKERRLEVLWLNYDPEKA